MKILIVDDEIMVRTKLKYIFEVELLQYPQGEQFQLCGEAVDGQQALDMIEKFRPDIVISDMKMPVMDGLELSKQCHEKYPGISFIALSNYDDFGYVKGTLVNGAVDYILKHSLNVESLYEVLKEIARKKRESRTKEELSVSSITLLKNAFIVNLLTHAFRSEETVADQLQSLEIPLQVRRVVAVGMWVKDYSKNSFDDKNILSFSIVNIIEEIMRDQNNGAIGYLEDGRYALLFSYKDLRSEQKIQELLTASLNRIRFCMKKFLNFTVYFFVGQMQDSILNVGKEYKNIDTIYQKKLYIEKDYWFHQEEDVRANGSAEILLDGNMEREIRRAILEGREQETEELVAGIFRNIYYQKPEETHVKMVVANLLNVIRKAGNDAGVQMDAIYRETISNKEILEASSLYEIQDQCQKQLKEIFHRAVQAEETNRSPYLKKAVDYIYHHYKEELSQGEIAEMLGISSSYLSTLFKNEMKQSFPAFLMKVRLKYAVYLLEENKLSLKEIAEECGFSDYVYFLKSFKKKYGCTPKEYIKKQ